MSDAEYRSLRLNREEAADAAGADSIEAFNELVLEELMPDPVEEDENGESYWTLHEINDALVAGSANIETEPVRVPNKGSVYVIGFAQFVKIGWSGDVPARMRDLQRGVPEQLTLYATFPASMRIERQLHARFNDLRTRGEWFRFEGLIAIWIAEGCSL